LPLLELPLVELPLVDAALDDPLLDVALPLDVDPPPLPLDPLAELVAEAPLELLSEAPFPVVAFPPPPHAHRVAPRMPRYVV
jgi:hypothetical protein